MDDLPPIVRFLYSPLYQRITAELALLCIGLAVLFTVLALAHYGRAREGGGTGVTAPWALLIGTWRDSMIISLLYVAEGLLYRASQLADEGLPDVDSRMLLLKTAAAPLGLVLLILMFAIGYLRIRALSRWLATHS